MLIKAKTINKYKMPTEDRVYFAFDVTPVIKESHISFTINAKTIDEIDDEKIYQKIRDAFFGNLNIEIVEKKK